MCARVLLTHTVSPSLHVVCSVSPSPFTYPDLQSLPGYHKITPALMSTNKRMIKKGFFNATWIFPSLGLRITKERSKNEGMDPLNLPPSLLSFICFFSLH